MRKEKTGTAIRAVQALAYIALVNTLYFLYLRELLFWTIGQANPFVIAALWLGFLGALFAFGRAPIWGRPQNNRPFIVIAFLNTALSYGLLRLAEILPTDEGLDWSWIRVEMLKTLPWLRMHMGYAPVLSAALIAVLIGMLVASIRDPRNPWLRWLTLVVPAGVSAATVVGFAITDVYLAGYLIFFALPVVVFWVFLAVRFYRAAFLLAPLVVHSVLTGMFYLGYLPVPAFIGVRASLDDSPGVRMISHADMAAPWYRREPGRQVFLVGSRVFYAFGAMGTTELVSYDRVLGTWRQSRFLGLFRDLRLTADGSTILAVDWQNPGILSINPATMEVICRANMQPFKLNAPWAVRQSGDRLYLSNVSDPVVARFIAPESGPVCRVEADGSLDLFQSGYLDNTDGAYEIQPYNGRLYVSAGFFGRRYMLSVVEIDVENWTVLRDVHMAGGSVLFPIPGTDRVLVPSYYRRAIYEVALETMTLTRTIHADANILAMAYDARRGLIFGVSRVAGTLSVIRDADGALLKRVLVGKNPGGLAFDEAEDKLYLGGSFGLYEIDLPAFLGSAS